MKEEEIQRYAEIVDALGSEYCFGYSNPNKSPFIVLTSPQEHRINGLILGYPDALAVDHFSKNSCFDFVTGMFIEGEKKLHLFEETEFFPYYISRLKRTLFSEEDEEAIRKDLQTLSWIEGVLFEAGIEKHLPRIEGNSRNVIRLRP